MTIIACLLAFVVGLLIGWLGLRAIGWLCFICAFAGHGAALELYLKNTGGSSVSWETWYLYAGQQHASGNMAGGTGCSYVAGCGTGGCNAQCDSSQNFGSTWYVKINSGPMAGTCQAVTPGVCFDLSGAPPPNNYCWACASWGPNPCLQSASVTVIEAGAGATRNDGTFSVLPGQSFSLCATNTDMTNFCPFQLILSVTSDCRDPVTVTANSTSGYLGGGGTQGNNNPQTGGGGNNTTNAPTGTSGTNVANIDSINALIRELQLGFGLLDGDLKTINGNILPLAKENTLRGATNILGQIQGSMSNLATEATSRSISNLLSRLTNAAAVHSNVFLAPMIAFTNFIGTNGWEGVSNTVLGEATATSNLWNYAVNSRASGIWALTNAIATPDAGDEDVWKYSFTNAMTKSRVEMDLNPMHSKAAFVFDWVKLGLKFFAQIAVFLYMLNRIEDAWVKLLHTPGAGVGKMNPLMSLPLWFKSNALFVTLVLAIIVFGTGALDTFLSNTGGWWANPFSSTVVTGMSTNARYVKGALIIIEGMIPIAELCLLIVLTTIFDLLLTGHIMFWSVMTRRLAE